jgi:uncharacterized membrane protein
MNIQYSTNYTMLLTDTLLHNMHVSLGVVLNVMVILTEFIQQYLNVIIEDIFFSHSSFCHYNIMLFIIYSDQQFNISCIFQRLTNHLGHLIMYVIDFRTYDLSITQMWPYTLLSKN